jgi:hypothetical protein
MFLIFLEIGVYHDSILNIFDIDFIKDIGEEVICKLICLMDIQSLIAFFHICDIAINKIKDELTDIQLRFNFLDLIWQYTDKIPKDCPDVLTVL